LSFGAQHSALRSPRDFILLTHTLSDPPSPPLLLIPLNPLHRPPASPTRPIRLHPDHPWRQTHTAGPLGALDRPHGRVEDLAFAEVHEEVLHAAAVVVVVGEGDFMLGVRGFLTVFLASIDRLGV
jgi:hypothetical protein